MTPHDPALDSPRGQDERDAVSEQGLTDKFKVERLTESSRGIDHSECRYFVLDPEHDPLAFTALKVYAIEAHLAGNESLARDLHAWVRSCSLHPTPASSVAAGQGEVDPLLCPGDGCPGCAHCRSDDGGDSDVATPVVLDLEDAYFDAQTLPDALADYEHVHSTTGICVKHPSGRFCGGGR